MNLFRFSVCRVVPVAELIVHPEHNRILQIHDIALLRLGLISLQILPFIQLSGERVDLISFPPVCLPSHGQNFDVALGNVYGYFYFS